MAKPLPQDTASFVIRLVPTDPRNLKTFVTFNPAREEFWRSTAQIDPDRVDADIDLCESRFLQTFATRLRDTLIARLRIREGTVEDRGTKAQQLNLPGVRRLRLTIESHEYGSLEAKVLVDGATTIASAFSGRMDLLSAFVEHYTPQVFVAGLPIDPVNERPVSATILAGDDLANVQFKAVLDDLAKRKASDKVSASGAQGSVQGPSYGSNSDAIEPPLVHRAALASGQSGAQTSQRQDPHQTGQVDRANAVSPERLPNGVDKPPSTVDSDSEPARKEVAAQSQADARDPNPAIQLDQLHPYEPRAQPTPQIIVVPQQYPNAPPPPQQLEHGQRNNRLWIVANLSLLFPVLLALLVLYFTYSGLKAERDQIAIQRSAIERREKEIQQLMLARERQLFEALHPGGARTTGSSSGGAASGATP